MKEKKEIIKKDSRENEGNHHFENQEKNKKNKRKTENRELNKMVHNSKRSSEEIEKKYQLK